jgi:hypothetical protein
MGTALLSGSFLIARGLGVLFTGTPETKWKDLRGSLNPLQPWEDGEPYSLLL